MKRWRVLILSLPTENTAARMRAWRALKACGAAVLRDGVYLMPGDDRHRPVLDTIAANVRANAGQPPRPGTPPPPRRFNGSAEERIGVPQAAPPPPQPAGRNALLVDDSELALRFLEVKLQPFGLRTARAATSAQAMAMLAQRTFDFVFLDIELGHDSALDGIALCHQIKRAHVLPADRPVPVVTLVSAHASEIDRVRGALAGADAYLGKPLDERALAQVLVEHGVKAATADA